MELNKKIQSLKDSINANIKFKGEEIMNCFELLEVKKLRHDHDTAELYAKISNSASEMSAYKNSLKLVEAYFPKEE